jgi:hypothetical protein
MCHGLSCSKQKTAALCEKAIYAVMPQMPHLMAGVFGDGVLSGFRVTRSAPVNVHNGDRICSHDFTRAQRLW